MLKKTLSLLVIALLIGSLAGCGSQVTEGSQDTSAPTDSAVLETTLETTDTAKDAASVTENSRSQTGDPESSSESSENKSSSQGSGEAAPSSASQSQSSESQSSESQSSRTQNSGSDTQTTDNSSSGESTQTVSPQNTDNNQKSGSSQNTDSSPSVYTANTGGKLDTTDLFTNRDLTQSPDLTEAQTIQAVSNKTITITEAGTYLLTGTASEFTVKVETDKESKVQLVLDQLNVTNSSFPVIYVISADKCFITTTGSSELSVTGTFTADGSTNTDAVIYSKDDLVFNGTGTLTIHSDYGNGISGKDDIKFTGGTYLLTTAKDSIEANDSIAVYDGNFTVRSSKDGLHAENDEDDTVGWIYIQNGTFSIQAASDAIQATTVCQIDGGSFSLSSVEGIESTYIQINGGNINLSATDDGLNASYKSRSLGTPTIEITGGTITITMSGNDVDCIDANGNIVISGGTVDVSYPTQGPSESFDCDGTATYTGGTIIINGSQVNSIPQSMMGGGMGGMGGRGGFMR